MGFAKFWEEFANICKDIIIPIFIVFILPILASYFTAKKNYYIELHNATIALKKFIIIYVDELEKEYHSNDSANRVTKFKPKEENK